ncbi:unnamed protein product [Rotaria socialis]|nr:unnamed protein product [Rotaria socialis]CAF3433236.1 unnamed protein product [Rotaria socialis]CAF3452075.1 unnamed protein product [Rotaria socialis]CAF3607015.1 unnamed protein product [Rotaria socialis]CAF4267137.1 unnamed protein product [Rotaria socialis]
MTAIITYEYYSASSKYLNLTQENLTNGIVSSKGSQMLVPKGPAFILMDSQGKYDGCLQRVNIFNYSKGIAIIQRGGNCTFSVKISRAKQYGAAAVIVYDPQATGQETYDIVQNTSDILCLYVQQSVGSTLFQLANDGRARLYIALQPINGKFDDLNLDDIWNSSQGAVVFIIIAISILICSCFSWLIFYCFQRNRVRTTKDRLDNRLENAAKKALTRIQLVTIHGNHHSEESCVICLDTIKDGDTVRELTCLHRFHQNCVDPWLINHRHCPLCNLDILAAYRVSIPGASTDLSSNQSENLTPTYTNTITSATVLPITTEQDSHRQDDASQSQQVLVHTQPQPIPSISATIKDRMHGEENPSFRSDDDHY